MNPSQQPTGQPSNVPTSIPTSVPTQIPVTAFPTITGATIFPTAVPTSTPTVNTKDFVNLQIYQRYLKNYDHLTNYNNPNIFAHYGYFFYKLSKSSDCQAWDQYKQDKLVTLFDNIKFSKAYIISEYQEFETGTSGYRSTNCTDANVIQNIVTSLK
jgi:hypothetical protein